MRNKTWQGVTGVGVALAIAACGGTDGGSTLPQKQHEDVADQRQLLVEAPVGSGDVSTFAGLGPPNAPGSGDHADARLGTFNDPAGIAVGHVNPTGIAYVADLGNNSVRAIIPTGASRLSSSVNLICW